MTKSIDEAYKLHILDKDKHARLVSELESVSRSANIPASMVWTSMHSYCSKEEIHFVTSMMKEASNGICGLAYLGEEKGVGVMSRMMAIAGACLRNFINARVMTLQEVLNGIKTNTLSDPTVMLIPDFFVGGKASGAIADWQLSGLASMLLARQSRGQLTFLYVQDVQKLELDYGVTFSNLILSKYKTVSAS